MHWFKCLLLATVLCVANCQNSAQPATANKTKHPGKVDSKENETKHKHNNYIVLRPASTAKPILDTNVKFQATKAPVEQLANKSQRTNSSKIISKDVENGTLNDIKPFLLFPILPFLFPSKDDLNPFGGKGDEPGQKNETKTDGEEGKPFIFFDFAFNIRRIPPKNATEVSKDTKIIDVKNLDESSDMNPKKRSVRESDGKIDAPEFFDDSPLFPDSELDEFLPKPDLFFPDLPFHHKPLKKLSRRKRDQGKKSLKPDFKTVIDAFDEAFMRTKREFERTDPVLSLLREAEQMFDDRKKPSDLIASVSDIKQKPNVKWRIQRNIKRLNNNHEEDLMKAKESPTIIVDKVVKIGEFHVHDDGHDGKSKKKKRETNDLRRSMLKEDKHDVLIHKKDSEIFPTNIFKLLKQGENKKKKRNHHNHLKAELSSDQPIIDIQSKEIKILPAKNISFLSVIANVTEDMKNPAESHLFANVPPPDKLESFNEDKGGSQRIQRRSPPPLGAKMNSKKYEDWRRNITELIDQFLTVVKEFDDTELTKRLEAKERDDEGVFDWTEKETLQSMDSSKNPRKKRQKDNFDKEYEFGKKERQVADLNYLFLTVTLPTVFVFSLALLICFFSLQVKGKLCTKLFKPRQILLIENDTPGQPTSKNTMENKKI